MFHILGFIFFFVLIILTIGFVILWRIVHTFIGMGKRMTGTNGTSSQNSQRKTYQQSGSSSEWSQQSTGSNSSDKKKVFGEDEGEYIEFEEVKE